MKWFKEVFLPSFKMDNQMNIITAKQRDIFERYIDFHTSEKGFLGLYADFEGYHFELFRRGSSGKWHEIYIKKIEKH